MLDPYGDFGGRPSRALLHEFWNLEKIWDSTRVTLLSVGNRGDGLLERRSLLGVFGEPSEFSLWFSSGRSPLPIHSFKEITK
jgi:hypothetical protein